MARRARDLRPRLLVVEDDPAIRESILMTVASDYRATVSTCQAEAEASLAAGSFDLALIDLRLPVEPNGMATSEEGGIQILRAVRARGITQGESGRALPVVVMTAYAGSPRLTASLFSDHGANDFVAKPFGKDELLAKLRRALLGKGAVAPTAERALPTIRLAFDARAERVHVEGLEPLDGGIFELLDVLRASFAADREARREPAASTFVTTQALTKRLGISAEALRRRILRARQRLQRDLERHLHRTTAEDDVIESVAWKGYRLNPLVVRVVDAAELEGR